MEIPLELSSRAASSSSCSRRDLAAVLPLLRADAVSLITSGCSVFNGAALLRRFRDVHRPSGHEFIERRLDVIAACAAVVEDVIIHRALVGQLAVAIDDEKTRRRLSPVAASDAAVDVE